MSEPDYNTKRDFSDPYHIKPSEISKEISDETHRIWKYGFEVSLPQQSPAQALARHAKILTLLSRQADIQTLRVVRLTWALVVLTLALLILTVYLCYDAYEKAESHNLTQKTESKQAHPNQ